MSRAAWTTVVLIGLLISTILFGATRGWFGPLVVCGVDAAPLCIPSSVLGAAAAWLLVVGTGAGLLCWQVVEWRRRPR